MSKVEEIERAAGQLPLKDLAELSARIDRIRWELEMAELAKGKTLSSTPMTSRLIVRDHTAFLNSFSPEDEGLYGDAAAR